jgi:hypothetical protein
MAWGSTNEERDEVLGRKFKRPTNKNDVESIRGSAIIMKLDLRTAESLTA